MLDATKVLRIAFRPCGMNWRFLSALRTPQKPATGFPPSKPIVELEKGLFFPLPPSHNYDSVLSPCIVHLSKKIAFFWTPLRCPLRVDGPRGRWGVSVNRGGSPAARPNPENTHPLLSLLFPGKGSILLTVLFSSARRLLSPSHKKKGKLCSISSDAKMKKRCQSRFDSTEVIC